MNIIVSPVQMYSLKYYGLDVVTPPRPRPQRFYRSHDHIKKSFSEPYYAVTHLCQKSHLPQPRQSFITIPVRVN